MLLALFHGEYLVGWILYGGIALLAIPVVALWWWRLPPRSLMLVAILYLALAVSFFILWMIDSSSVALSSLGFAWALPWSAVYLFAIFTLQVEIPVWVILPGFLVNASLIYFAAEFAKKRKLSHLGAG